MRTLTRLLPLLLALAALAPATAAAAEPPLRNVLADDLAPPLEGWTAAGAPKLRAIELRDGRALALSGTGSIRRALPSRPWSLSLDVRVSRGAQLELALGGRPLLLAQGDDGSLTVSSGEALSAVVPPVAGWAAGGFRHVEIAGFDPVEVHVDGTRVPNAIAPAEAIRIRMVRGSAQLTGLVATRRDDRRALVLHRLAELHARTKPRRYPIGVGADDGVLRFGAGWTDGFWAGSLWRARDLTRTPLFGNWARVATLDHLGREREQIHDQGFRYLESSAAGHDRLCRTEAARRTRDCRLMRKSAYSAANTLVQMARGNRATGTIPTVGPDRKCRNCASSDEVETIVDSVVNLGILDWVGRSSGAKHYRDWALRHARAVARLLVRPDGSTAQGVRTNRADGSVIAYEHRQGLSAESAWARGQAWAIYGFARTGRAHRQRDVVTVAERAARYLADRLPPTGVPLYDFDAPPGSPEDTSAGVIAAAGLFRLAGACERVDGACESSAARWERLARRMLTASLGHVDRHLPLGVLRDQVYSLGGSATWDDAGEFMFGVQYAVEAVDSSLAR